MINILFSILLSLVGIALGIPVNVNIVLTKKEDEITVVAPIPAPIRKARQEFIAVGNVVMHRTDGHMMTIGAITGYRTMRCDSPTGSRYCGFDDVVVISKVRWL